jgi:hypothetical protein
MKRKFKVTISYDVELDDPDTDSGSVTGLHIMDAVYEYQGGNVRGLTSVKPPVRYVTDKENMTWQEVK